MKFKFFTTLLFLIFSLNLFGTTASTQSRNSAQTEQKENPKDTLGLKVILAGVAFKLASTACLLKRLPSQVKLLSTVIATVAIITKLVLFNRWQQA